MAKKHSEDWKKGSRASPGSGKVGYLGKLRKAVEDATADPIDQRVEEAREGLTIRERMREYVERKGKK